jgi:hypothetical protein
MTRIVQPGFPFLLVAVLANGCGPSGDSRPAGAETGAVDSTPQPAASAEHRISNMMIGRRIGPGNRITEPTFEFAPQDTVYVSVAMSGTGGADRLTAAWRSQSGEVVQQSSEPIAPPGGNTAFHFSQPKGLKPGTYKVIVFLGGDSVETRVFAVKK